VEIPDEPHGIRGAHPRHRVAKNENIFAWIEKYTKPGSKESNAAVE
jgi:dipeptidyl aminopeptidase/acylaminoacyl peptidase